MDIENLGSVY